VNVVFHAGALIDFNESVDWYARRSVVASRRFVMAVDSAIERIVARADEMTFVDADHQECPLRRFPFRIIFRKLSGQILIVAIAHAKREPRYWRGR
jgi:plasmid stabilization system protein ParE